MAGVRGRNDHNETYEGEEPMKTMLLEVLLVSTIIISAAALPIPGPRLPDQIDQNLTGLLPGGPEPRYVPDQILVRFNTPENTNGMQAVATVEQIAAIHASIGATVMRSYSPAFLPGLQLVNIPDTMIVPDAVAWYASQPSVRYAEPDGICLLDDLITPGSPVSLAPNTSSIPDDPYYQYQWSLQNTGQDGGTPGADIRAPGAWNITTGSRDVIVAVLDTGVDYRHPDLIDNIWTDPVTGNHGYDFANNDSDPMDDDYHGTACASLIAATGNNSLAMTGVAWNTQIMAVKIYGFNEAKVSDAISGIQYATLHDADIISNSWNFLEHSQALIDAVNQFPGLAVWSAANFNWNTDDYSREFSQFQCQNTIAVMATDNNDEKADFSNFGRSSVHLAAPGVQILVMVPQNYTPESERQPVSGLTRADGRLSRPHQIMTGLTPGSADIPFIYSNGTSFSAPLVSGTAALIRAAHPDYSPAQIKAALLQSVDIIPSLSQRCITGGRLNASAAVLRNAQPYDAIGTINLSPKFRPGDLCPITVTVQNAGTEPWNASSSLSLRAENRDASLFRTDVYPLPEGKTVSPGESLVFSFTGSAPDGGGYQPQYRMYQNTTGFGQTITGYTSVTSAEILADIPDNLSGSTLIADNSSLYLIGGLNTTGQYSPAYRYDIRNLTWSTLSPMPKALRLISGEVIGGKIYIPGGYDNGRYNNTTYIYDIGTDRWSSHAPEIPIPGRAMYGTAALGDRLYVLGGFITWDQTTDLVNYLNTTTRTWHQAPPMHVPRTGFAVSSGNNTILVAGGYNFSFVDTQHYSSAERFDGVNWSWIADIPDTIAWYRAASASEPDGSLWIAGGDRETSAGIVRDSVGTYNLSENRWIVTPDLPTIWYPRYDLTGAMDEEGYLYTAQGSEEGNQNLFERLHVYTPPCRPVTDLHTTRIHPHQITWNWTVPDNRITQVQVALDGTVQTSLAPDITSYTAVRLKPDTKYEISLQTTDALGNFGPWVNNTAKTAHWYR